MVSPAEWVVLADQVVQGSRSGSTTRHTVVELLTVIGPQRTDSAAQATGPRSRAVSAVPSRILIVRVASRAATARPRVIAAARAPAVVEQLQAPTATAALVIVVQRIAPVRTAWEAEVPRVRHARAECVADPADGMGAAHVPAAAVGPRVGAVHAAGIEAVVVFVAVAGDAGKRQRGEI